MNDFQIIQKPCHPDNFQHGRNGKTSEGGVVIHRQLGHLAGTDNWFALSVAQRRKASANGVAFASSSHYGTSLAGEIHQYVAETDAAYHAGIKKSDVAGCLWKLLPKYPQPNLFTIGIELEGQSADIVSDIEYAAVCWLVAGASIKWGFSIDADHVTRHGDIYEAKRSICPGPGCDMNRILTESQAIKAQMPAPGPT
jgi:N-acetylmuramoyl-L-alanine amidase